MPVTALYSSSPIRLSGTQQLRTLLLRSVHSVYAIIQANTLGALQNRCLLSEATTTKLLAPFIQRSQLR